jgi:diguanylate cyclase (GGDEF)-like protein
MQPLFLRIAEYFGAHRVPECLAHERDRARQRMGIAGFFGLVLLAHMVWSSTFELQLLWLPLISFSYAAYALYHLRVVLVRPQPAVQSQYALLVLDQVFNVACLAALPPALAPIYPVLMVQIVRCGMRFGIRTMWLAWGVSAAAAAVAFPFSDFWSNDLPMAWSFVVMMLITPPLMGPLVRRLSEATEALRQAAGADPLTGLANRRTLSERTLEAQERSARDGTQLAMVLFDLDNFKSVNDTLGHAVGDQLLRRVAACIRSNCRASDVVARIGGDEFVLLLEALPREGGQAKAQEIASKIVAQIQRLAEDVAPGIAVSASAGLSCWHHAGEGPEAEKALMASADKAMYEAKHAGKSRVVMATELQPST